MYTAITSLSIAVQNPSYVSLEIVLSWILRNVDGLGLKVVSQGVCAADTTPRATRNSLSCIRNSVRYGVVAIDLTRTIPELLGDSLSQFEILCPNART